MTIFPEGVPAKGSPKKLRSGGWSRVRSALKIGCAPQFATFGRTTIEVAFFLTIWGALEVDFLPNSVLLLRLGHAWR